MRFAICALACGFLLALTGCGKQTGQVSGKVTRGDQAVSEAELLFQGKEGEQGRGMTGADGEYRLDYGAKKGLSPGPCRIIVSEYVRPDGKPLPPGEEGSALKSSGRALKRSYVFEQEIAAGAQRLDLDLTKGKLEK